MENLDVLCAKHGLEIANKIKDDILINKALGIIQEQGLYAYFLFLESQNDNKANTIRKESWFLLGKIIKNLKDYFWEEDTWPRTLETNVLNNLERLSLSLQMIEQLLIYARYHARAFKKVIL